MTTRRVSIRLDQKTFQKLEELREQHGFLTVSETVRYILREFFKKGDRDEKK
jgi:metal-responsive CopG/Arc/MetJ family transcriptional regulator